MGDLGTIITGNTPPRSRPELYGSHTPFVKATDISENEKYTYNPEEGYSEEGYKKYIKSLVPKGSTCVVTIGSIGKKMTMAHCDLFINQAMNAIIPFPNFDKDYVYYAVRNVLSNIKALDSGTASGRENVSKSAFSRMKVIIDDDLLIQKRIATTLSRYDSLIDNYQKQIKLLEEAAQRLYKEWFVKLRFPGHESTKIVDGVPEGWEKKKLEDMVFENGKRITKKNRDSYECYIPIDCLPKKQLSYINFNSVEQAESSLIAFSRRDIIFGAMRPYFHKVCVARHLGITRSTCLVLQAKEPEYSAFATMMLFDEKTIKYASSISVGTTMPYTRWKDFKNMEIMVPHIKIARIFNTKILKILSTCGRLADQIILLTESRDRLLPKLLSGEIEV